MGTAKALSNVLSSKDTTHSTTRGGSQRSTRTTEPQQQDSKAEPGSATAVEDMPIKPVRLTNPQVPSPGGKRTQESVKEMEHETEDNQYEYVPRAEEHVEADAEDHNPDSKSDTDDVFIRRHELRPQQQGDRLIIQPDSDDDEVFDAPLEQQDGTPEARTTILDMQHNTKEREHKATSTPESSVKDTLESPSPPSKPNPDSHDHISESMKRQLSPIEANKDSGEETADLMKSLSPRLETYQNSYEHKAEPMNFAYAPLPTVRDSPKQREMPADDSSRQDEMDEATPEQTLEDDSHVSDQDVTPTRDHVRHEAQQDHEEDGNDTEKEEEQSTLTPPASISHASGPESNSARPSGMLYMDYLMHPGSGRKGRSEMLPENRDSEDFDCATSPYSVD